MTQALQQTEIDQGVGQCIEIGDGIAITKVGAFNAETNCLAVDAFGGGTLRVDFFIGLTVPVQRISKSCANAGRHGDGAAAFASALMMNRARLFDEFLLDVFGKERTDILAAFMLNDGEGSICICE